MATKVTSGNNVVEYAYDHKGRKTEVYLNSETPYVSYAYSDVSGGKKTVASLINGDTAETVTDAVGNVLQTRYNGTTQTQAEYDTAGKLVKLTDNVSGRAESYTYDELDRVTKVTDGTLTETAEYNADGNISKKTVAGVEYTYEYKDNLAKELKSVSVGDISFAPQTDCLGRAAGKVIAVGGEKIAEESISYRKIGDKATNMPSVMRFGEMRPTTAQNANAAAPSVIATTPSVIASGEAARQSSPTDPVIASAVEQSHPTTVISSGANAVSAVEKSLKFVLLDNLKYTYDESGNITEVRENGTLAARYTYDKLNRLVREDNKPLKKTCTYSYDNNGNILNKREFAFTLCGKDKLEELDCNATDYAYNGDRLLAFGSETFEYDLLGNPTTYKNKNVSWSNGRQMTAYDGNTFTYDGRGRRTVKNGITFTYDSAGNLLQQSNGLEFIYDNNSVAGVKHNGNTYLYRRNAQGDIIALLDNNGVVVVKYVYDAWGNHSTVVLDSTCTELSQLNPFRYRGYYYDTETGLYFLKTRYYDPITGRFVTIDDLSYLDPETINGLNLYAYCANNPVMAVDPEGTMPKWLRWLLGGLIIVAAVTLSIVTAGLAAPISTALGSGLLGAVVGGAVAGAVGGAIASFGISIATQGISNGFGNIDWKKVGKDTLIGAASGAIAGGVFGAIRYVASAAKVANAISGLKNAENGMIKASEVLKNTPIAIKGGVVSTERIAAQLSFNTASQIYSKAQSVYAVSEFVINKIYQILRFGFKQLISNFFKG